MEPTRLDLTAQTWTVEDFQTNELEVDYIGLLIRPKAAATAQGVKSSKGRERAAMRRWRRDHGPTPRGVFFPRQKGLDQVSRALDQEADALVSRSSQRGFGEEVSVEQQLASTTDWIQKLQIIKHNLLIHNQIIQTHNTALRRKVHHFARCADHSDAVARIDGQLRKLTRSSRHLQTECAKVLADEIAAMQQRPRQHIDSNYIEKSYPNFIKRIRNVSASQQQELIDQYNRAVNESYLEQLAGNIEKGPLLTLAVESVLGRMGLYSKKPSAMRNTLRKRLQAEIQKLITHPDSLRALSLPEMVSRMNELNFRSAVELMAYKLPDKSPATLTKPQQNALVDLLQAVSRFEALLEYDYHQVVDEALVTTMPFVQGMAESMYRSDSAMMKPYFIEWAKMAIPALPTHNCLDALKGAMLGAKESLYHRSIEDFERDLVGLKAEMDKLRISEKSKLAVPISEGGTPKTLGSTLVASAMRMARYLNWRSTQGSHRRFVFSQADWGGAAILDRGICKAINYRWILRQMQNPTLDIRKSEDLVSTSERAARNPLLTARDRFIQAQYTTDVRFLKGIEGTVIPEVILKQDKLKGIVLSKKPVGGIRALYDQVLKQDKEGTIRLGNSAGVIDISAYRQSKDDSRYIGHALGMRVDTTNRQFAFWDVNGGYYAYDTPQEMIQNFEEYLKLFYDPPYDEFYATQYVPRQ